MPVVASSLCATRYVTCPVRLRPKLMTVSVVLAGLLPILWSTGVGSDIMKPIAAPIVDGMVTSTIHVLIITPA